MKSSVTVNDRRPSRGRSIGLVPFIFGVVGEPEISGAALRTLLQQLGLSDDAARGVLARMRREGQLSSYRRGRGAIYRLSGEFAASFERARDEPTALPWDGQFHALLYQIPEKHRSFRDALRRTALFSGYGLLQSGVLIGLRDRSELLKPLLERAPEGAQLHQATLVLQPAEARAAASTAWDLPGLAATYRAHIANLAAGPTGSGNRVGADGDRGGRNATPVGQGLVPVEGASLFRQFTEVLMPTYTDLLREPGLPPQLMPSDWPGPQLREVRGAFLQHYGPAVARHVSQLLEQIEQG